MKKTFSLLLIATCLFSFSPFYAYPIARAAGVCTSDANLVVNGGFETPVVTDPHNFDIFPTGSTSWNVDWVNNAEATTTYNGETRPSAQLEIQRNGFQGDPHFFASKGLQWAELDSDWDGPNGKVVGEPASIHIYQDIPTIPGQDYTFSFDFSARPDSPEATNILNARWDGSDVATITEAKKATNIWNNHTYTLTATASTTRIEFSDAGIGNSYGVYLDNISVTCKDTVVPPPPAPPVIPTCVAGTNLLANADFELPVVTHPDKWDIYASGTPTLDWNVDWVSTTTTHNGKTRPTLGQLELQKNGHLGFISNTGVQWAELDSDWFGPNFPSDDYPSSVKIFQDIPTIPGNSYKLSFAFSPRPDAPSIDENILKVKWDSADVATIARASASTTQTEWQNYNYDLTASASTTRVEFSDAGIPNAVGTYLDSTSLICNGTTTPPIITPPPVPVTPPSGGGGGGGGSSGGNHGGGSGSGTTPAPVPQGQVLGASVGPLTCSASTEETTTNKQVTYTANGGDGVFNWSIPANLKLSSGVSSTLSGSYDKSGTYTVVVKSADQTAMCSTHIRKGQVLGDEDLPGIPTTGGGGDIITLFTVLFLGILTTNEIIKKVLHTKSDKRP